jgi:catechol 2,3-dioxygenase-like lactoylglutathione lyase family enzyme
MALERLDHFTIRLQPDDLAATRSFYVDVLGLSEGKRPGFSFPGHWLYCGSQPVVHLAGTAGSDDPASGGTGKIDHIAFHATGLQDMLQRLRTRGVTHEQRPVPGQELHQVFVHDPNGIKVELNYSAEEARAADH